jgi:translation initiation factor IF-2
MVLSEPSIARKRRFPLIFACNKSDKGGCSSEETILKNIELEISHIRKSQSSLADLSDKQTAVANGNDFA